MENRYNPAQIEAKWQQYWRGTNAFTVVENEKPKFYCLVMLPYPSGFLHMGHVRNYAMGDAVAWYKRLCGFNVLHPIGWDSFGQPAEQAAIKNNTQPGQWTEQNIENMRMQLQRLGISYDWSREIAAHRSEYYHWDQWFFLQLYQRGLVYKRMSPVNWCTNCQTVLSNEQAEHNRCWRCKAEVITKELSQWFIRITEYADQLLDDMREIESSWPEAVLTMQRNWIGREVAADGQVSYRLRDWGISRQRFWGAPIPIVYCKYCQIVPVPIDQLPVLLPVTAAFTGIGASPLAGVAEFVNTACPKCGMAAQRETDTMDTFVDSAWYYFRYCDPNNNTAPFDSEKIKHWLPVDIYIGGIDNAVMHLLYTRFWTKMMRDIGLIDINEPVQKLSTQGMVTNIVSETGEWKAMSKSLGNGVNPDEMIAKYGSDAVRLFVLFAAPPEQELRWSESGIEGMVRFLRRIYNIVNNWQSHFTFSTQSEQAIAISDNAVALRRFTHRTIKRITADFQQYRFNTIIAALMELTNSISEFRSRDFAADEIFSVREAIKALIIMLAPFVPHFAAEMWQVIGNQTELLTVQWPIADEQLAQIDQIELPVQVNGKLCKTIKVSVDISEEVIRDFVLTDEKIAGVIKDRDIIKVIFVPMRVINIVTEKE